MAEWTLGRDQVREIRDARAALLAAAATGVPALVERAVADAVAAMWQADFSRATICSLVTAAVEAGLPRRRTYTGRATDVRYWGDRAGAVADAIAAGRPAARAGDVPRAG